MDLDWLGLRLLIRIAPLIFVALMFYEPTRLWIFDVFMEVRQARIERLFEGTALNPTP